MKTAPSLQFNELAPIAYGILPEWLVDAAFAKVFVNADPWIGTKLPYRSDDDESGVVSLLWSVFQWPPLGTPADYGMVDFAFALELRFQDPSINELCHTAARAMCVELDCQYRSITTVSDEFGYRWTRAHFCPKYLWSKGSRLVNDNRWCGL